MKRTLCLMLTLALLVLPGCASKSNQVKFYYPRAADAYRYGTADGVIAVETRDISGYEGDLTYLLRLYMDGPASDGFLSPFPAGTYLLSTQMKEDMLTLVFSAELSALEEANWTLVCACLVYTCYDLVDVPQIQIVSGTKTEIFTQNSFTLVDNAAPDSTQ